MDSPWGIARPPSGPRLQAQGTNIQWGGSVSTCRGEGPASLGGGHLAPVEQRLIAGYQRPPLDSCGLAVSLPRSGERDAYQMGGNPLDADTTRVLLGGAVAAGTPKGHAPKMTPTGP